MSSFPATEPVDSDPGAHLRPVLLLALGMLAPAHLMLTAYFSSAAINALGAAIVVAVAGWWLVKKKDEFGLLMALFLCTHFGFGDSSLGGLWSYVLCGALMIGLARGFRPTLHLSAVPAGVSALVLLLLAHQLVGTATNPYPAVANAQATIVIVSQLVVFYYCASLPLDARRVRLLLTIWFLVAAWVFLASANQRFQCLGTDSPRDESPLLPQRSDARGAVSTVPAGTFGNSELLGEYFAIVLVSSLLMVSRSRELRELGLKPAVAVSMILMAAIALVLSTSRAAILLAMFGSACLFVWSVLFASPAQAIRRVAGMAAVLLFAGAILSQLDAFQEIREKFALLDPANMSVDSIASGQAIDRSNVYPLGVARLSEDSWWLGYGYNIGENNHESMGITSRFIEDYHCLYLMLPIYYGWLGAVAYVTLVIGTAVRLGAWCWRARALGHDLTPMGLAFVILWGIFLLDQAKISCTRNPSYFLMTWFWLGWSHSIANSLKTAVGASDAVGPAAGDEAGDRSSPHEEPLP